jgi:hypothetical protein
VAAGGIYNISLADDKLGERAPRTNHNFRTSAHLQQYFRRGDKQPSDRGLGYGEDTRQAPYEWCGYLLRWSDSLTVAKSVSRIGSVIQESESFAPLAELIQGTPQTISLFTLSTNILPLVFSGLTFCCEHMLPKPPPLRRPRRGSLTGAICPPRGDSQLSRPNLFASYAPHHLHTAQLSKGAASLWHPFLSALDATGPGRPANPAHWYSPYKPRGLRPRGLHVFHCREGLDGLQTSAQGRLAMERTTEQGAIPATCIPSNAPAGHMLARTQLKT